MNKKRVIISVIVLIIFFISGNFMYKKLQLSMMDEEVDKILSEKNLKNKIVTEKSMMSSKMEVYTKEIVFNDEKDIVYKIRIYDYPGIINILKLKEYSPSVTSKGYKDYEVILDKTKVKHGFEKK